MARKKIRMVSGATNRSSKQGSDSGKDAQSENTENSGDEFHVRKKKTTQTFGRDSLSSQ
jgi:hypothetical protein